MGRRVNSPLGKKNYQGKTKLEFEPKWLKCHFSFSSIFPGFRALFLFFTLLKVWGKVVFLTGKI